MSRHGEDDPLGERLWAAETAPLPSIPALDRPPRAEGVASRAVVMRLSHPGDVGRVFHRDATVFVLMPDPPPEGALVECVLVHPGDGREVMVPAEVVRVGETLAGPGVELRFAPPGPAAREALIRFVRQR